MPVSAHSLKVTSKTASETLPKFAPRFWTRLKIQDDFYRLRPCISQRDNRHWTNAKNTGSGSLPSSCDGHFSLFRFISARFVFTHILVQLFWFFVNWFAMMTTIPDDSFSDDSHNVRKRSKINNDCMLCFSNSKRFEDIFFSSFFALITLR